MVYNSKKSVLSVCCLLCIVAVLTGCQTPMHFPRRATAVVPDVKPLESIDTVQLLSGVASNNEPRLTLTWKDALRNSLDGLVGSEMFRSSQLGLCVYDLVENEWIYQHNADQRMRPASCEKVVTSVSALHCLGNDYQLRTRLCITGSVNAEGVLEGDVYVIGGMDPMLSKSDVLSLAKALQNAGVKQIGGKLYKDLTLKDNNPLGWGWCWDDKYGPLTALSVDGKDNFTEVWLDALKTYKITVPNSARTTASRVRIDGVLAMPADNGLQSASCPTSAVLVAEVAHSIDDLLMKMMKDSDNIYAESLFYQIAFHSGERQAGRKQAVSQINALIDEIGLQSADYQIADGSGLSLYNYVSPTLLATLLRYAFQHEAIMSHLLPVLPQSGVDGTLKNRMKVDSPAHGIVYAKTGTVEGISSLSGFVLPKNGHAVCFSIINQGVIKSSEGRSFQDKVCEILASELSKL